MTLLMDIAEFLLARIADDAAAARQVRMDDGWELGMVTGPDDAYDPFLTISPARVLAECEAKRRIVEGCAVMRRTLDYYGVPTSFDDENILALLALPYADHPDYREEWRV